MLVSRRGCLLLNVFTDGKYWQLNQNTAHLDASVVYGSTEEVARSLREFDGGRLRVTVIGGDYHLLPIDPARRDCIGDGKGCFTAGDHRVNQYTALTVMHIIFVRLHNRYATDIARINPHWDDERLFQETRKIIGALMQHITYNEYLPSVLGRIYSSNCFFPFQKLVLLIFNFISILQSIH